MMISPQLGKHIPKRTCVACREVKAKQELIRLVRISDMSVEIDTGGKKAGRGAYLCRGQDCWQSGVEGGRLEHTLQTTITYDNREKLIRSFKDLFVDTKEE